MEQRDAGRLFCSSFLRPHDLTCAWGGVSFSTCSHYTPPPILLGPNLLLFIFIFFGMLRLDAHSL